VEYPHKLRRRQNKRHGLTGSKGDYKLSSGRIAYLAGRGGAYICTNIIAAETFFYVFLKALGARNFAVSNIDPLEPVPDPGADLRVDHYKGALL
jgi:hypothetical protein